MQVEFDHLKSRNPYRHQREIFDHSYHGQKSYQDQNRHRGLHAYGSYENLRLDVNLLIPLLLLFSHSGVYPALAARRQQTSNIYAHMRYALRVTHIVP